MQLKSLRKKIVAAGTQRYSYCMCCNSLVAATGRQITYCPRPAEIVRTRRTQKKKKKKGIPQKENQEKWDLSLAKLQPYKSNLDHTTASDILYSPLSCGPSWSPPACLMSPAVGQMKLFMGSPRSVRIWFFKGLNFAAQQCLWFFFFFIIFLHCIH